MFATSDGDYWWMRNRVRRDRRAIKVWMESRGVRRRGWLEGQMWAYLMDDLESILQWTRTLSEDRDILKV